MIDLERIRNEMSEDAGCKQALTLVFIENQTLEQVYEPETAFVRGTAFPDLDKPLCVGGMNRDR